MTMTFQAIPDGTISIAFRLINGTDDPEDRIWQSLASYDHLVLYPLSLRFGGFASGGVVSIRGRKPFVRHDVFVEGMDRFGNLVQTVGHMLTDWDFTEQLTPPCENPITHFNLRGDLVPDETTAEFYPFNPASAPHGVTVVNDFGISSVYPSQFMQVAYQPAKLVLELPDPHVSGGVSYTYDRLTVTSTRVQYLRKTIRPTGNGFQENWHVIRYEYDGFALGGLPYGDYAIEDILGQCLHRHSYWVFAATYAAGYRPPDPDYWWVDIGSDAFPDYASNSYPDYNAVVVSGNRGGDRLTPLISGVQDSDRSFPAFCSYTSVLLRDCYAGAFLASNDAMDKMISRFSSNHIEFLVEVRSLLKGVDVVRAVKALMAMRRSPTAAVRALLRLLADVKLVWSFGIAPTLSDAADVSKKALALDRKFAGLDLYTDQTIKGKFSFDIPDEYAGGFQGLHLTVRSTIRIRLDEDSILPSLLPWRALGLLPSVSTLWDLVPYSFLVDWFLPVGAIADNFETSGLMWMSQVSYSTHSVNLEWLLPEDLMNLYGVRNANGEHVGKFQLYDRFVLSHLPTAAPTALPLYGGLGVPDWSLLGALVYTKLIA